MESNTALQTQKPKGAVVISTDHGDITLSNEIVRKYLVNGNGAVTDQEVMMFMALCKHQSLNPFIREAYLIKYGNNSPATIVTGKEVFTKRAHKTPECKGFKAGVIVQNNETKETKDTMGFCPPGSTIVGGWGEVHLDGWLFPLRVEVDLKEYEGKTHTGEVTKMWKEKKATMIRKVALVQALREAFPEKFQGMYSPEEINSIDRSLPDEPVNIVDLQPDPATPPNRGRPPKQPDPPPVTNTPPVETEMPDFAVDPDAWVECPRSSERVVAEFCANHCPDRTGCPSWPEDDDKI